MNNKEPFFSIIIPTYNRPTRLQKCLSAVAEMDYPKAKFEVIVVDDGSSAQLDQIAESLNGKLNVRLLKQDNQGPASARNRGTKEANGEILAFTDDDCLPNRQWLRALAESFSVNPDSMIGGKIMNALPENAFSSASQTLVAYLYSYYNDNSKDAAFLTSNNLAVAAERFREFGGFDEAWGRAAAEDREFCDRWRLQGNKMVYEPKAVVNHAHIMRFSNFIGQHFNYGRGAYYFHKTRFRRNHGAVKIEPPSFYLGLVQYPFLKFNRSRAVVISLLIIIAQAANIVGYFWEKFVQFSKHVAGAKEVI